jgi:hypothetical protein
MNERFKQLAVQSKLGSAEFGNGVQYYVATQETFEKFAELIVNECALVANEHNEEAEGVHLGVGRVIKNYFGVDK